MSDIFKPQKDLTSDSSGKKGFLIEKDGVKLKKGIVLTPEYIRSHQIFFENMCNIFTAYPDLFLDLIQNPEMKTDLFPYQRLLLRAIMRFQDIYVTAPRAFSKSFLTILGLILQCIFIPRTKRFIAAPFKTQSAAIAKEKITEIYERWPLLKKEVLDQKQDEDIPGNFGKDYVELKFKNGSVFMVVGTGDASRGGRKNGGLIDEARDHDGDELEKVVYPFLNVARRLPDGSVNPWEPNQQRIFMTSAGSKSTYAYSVLIDLLEDAIINPQGTFVFGCDYRVPLRHGLLTKEYVNKLKISSSFDEQSFAQEYLSIWGGGSDESWFNYETLMRHRKIKNPETHKKNIANSNYFYLLSVDVGRLKDQTVVCVYRVSIDKNGIYRSTLVNLYVLGRTAQTKTFQQQAIDLKKIILAFEPEEVVIDINGIGRGLADEMIKEQMDANGVTYPAYGFFNNDDYAKVQPHNCDRILYSIVANSKLNSNMHSNAYTRVAKGLVTLLISEQQAKSELLSTKIGRKMTAEQRVERLMPHKMTSSLIQEICNLKLKKTGVTNEIAVEKINTSVPKDKFSAFEMGLWRIKEKEDEHQTKMKRQNRKSRQLIFFSGGA